MPKLPEKHSLSNKLNNFIRFDLDFIKKRQKELDLYLQELVSNERICEDHNLFCFLANNEKEFKELKAKNLDRNTYWTMISSIHPFNLLENYNYMKTYLSVKCTQKLFHTKRSHVINLCFFGFLTRNFQFRTSKKYKRFICI